MAPTPQNTLRAPPNMPVGKTFQDCPDVCPVMVVVPAGRFSMGSPQSEPGRQPNEGPQIGVKFAAPYAIGKFEITYDQYMACAHDQGCTSTADGQFGTNLPATFITYNHARQYADWLSKKTGRAYHIPSEAEWEYAARAGTTTAYWWGAAISNAYENMSVTPPGGDCCIGIAPVGSVKPNGFGLYDMLGNAREFTDDCPNKYVPDYTSTPTDGRPRYDQPNRTAPPPWVCAQHLIRGGSFSDHEVDSRAAVRRVMLSDMRSKDLGFRVATHDIAPH